MGKTSYAVALGSNRRHGRHGAPRDVVAAAMEALADAGLEITARSAIRSTPAMGGAGRSFANAAVIARSHLQPVELFTILKVIERRFGRRPGKRWGARVLDLDLLLKFPGEGRGPVVRSASLSHRFRRRTLIVPHPELAKRDFVLQPLEEIASDRRVPPAGLTVRQLRARLRRARPLVVRPVAPGPRVP